MSERESGKLLEFDVVKHHDGRPAHHPISTGAVRLYDGDDYLEVRASEDGAALIVRAGGLANAVRITIEPDHRNQITVRLTTD